MKYSIYIILAFAAFACGEDPWTEDQKSDFITSCEEEGGSPGYCDCFMEKTMDKYPRFEEALDMSFEEAVEISEECE